MACYVTYKEVEYTEDEFKSYVEANPEEFSSYSVSSVEAQPLGIRATKAPEDDYWDMPKKKFEGKQKIIDDSGAKLGKYGYYYHLNKEQQRQFDAYRKRHVNADPTITKRGFHLYGDLSQDVYLKKVRNKHYLYIDLKHLVNSNGVLLPRVYGKIRFKIDLVYNTELDKYLASFNEETPFVSEQEAEIRKHLFKTKGISPARAANFYLFNVKEAIVKLVKDLGGKVSYKDLSNMDTETIDYVKSLVDIDKKVEEIKKKYHKELEDMDEDELRQQIMSTIQDQYDPDTIQGIWKLVNVLPVKFLKLISFDYINEATAFFTSQDERNVEDVAPNTREIQRKKVIIWGTSINVALRRMVDEGLISQEDVDKLNKELRKEIDKVVKAANGKIVPYDTLRTVLKKGNFIKHLTKTVEHKGITASASFFFEIFRGEAMNTISEYAGRQNKGLTEIVDFLGRLSHERLNSLFSNVSLGTFEGIKDTLNFPIDYTVIAAHELGHALDFYLHSTKKDTRFKLNAFITALTQLPEFANYLAKGLHSRGYQTANTKEIAADLYAWFMAKAGGIDVSNSHIASLDQFMYDNEAKVEQLFKDIFEIKTKRRKKGPIEEVTDYIKELIKDLMEWVNDKLGIELYKFDDGIQTEPAGAAVQRILTALDRLTMQDDTFDPDTILDSENQGDFYWKNLTENDISISELEEGLKQATKDQEAFTKQSERVASEVKKIEKILGEVKEGEIRSRLRDAIRYIKENPKELKNFTYFLFETERVLKHYSEELKKVSTKPEAEAIRQLTNAQVIAETFKPMITYLKKEFRYIDNNNTFKKLINDISGYYDEIQNIYTSEAETLAVEVITKELTPDAANAFKLLKADLDNINNQIERARATGSPEDYLRRLGLKADRVKAQIRELVPNKELIEDMFKGLRGDLNWFTGNFRSTLALGDPIISGYARRLKRGYNQVRNNLAPLRNQADSQLKAYMRATGADTLQSMEKFYEGLYQTTAIDVYDDEGNKTTEEYMSLLNPVDNSFYNDDAKYRSDIKQAKKTGDPKKIQKAQKDYSDWLSKYSERKYVDEWYDRYDLLTPEAYDRRQEIIEELKNIQRGNKDSLSDADLEKIHDLKQKLSRLGSKYDDYGKLKVGEELAIANSVKAFNRETARMSKYEVTPENQRWFDIIVEKKKEQVTEGIISQKDFDNWFKNNTQTVISEEYYKARKVVTDNIDAILSKLPRAQFNKSVSELWEVILDVARPHRDSDNIVDGTDLNGGETASVKSSEDAIEAIKATLVRFSGLTMSEEQELQALWASLDSLDEEAGEIDRFLDLKRLKKEYQDYLGQYITKEQRNALFSYFGELAAMSKYVPTTYYTTTFNEKMHEFRAQIDPNNQLMLSDVKERFIHESPWYRENHITRTKKMFSEGKTWFVDEDQPLYTWQTIEPTNKDWIVKNSPGFAFKTRIVKPEYVNSKYQGLNFEYYRNSDEDDFRLVPKTFVDGKKSSYMSEDYERLKNSSDEKDRAKYNMLQFLINMHLSGQKLLPEYKRLGYLLPGVQKDKYDRARESGLSGIGTAIRDQFRTTQEDRDLTLGDTSQIDLSIIPVKYSTKVKPQDQDLDLLGTILKHRFGAEEYNFLEKELPYAKVIQSALRTAPADVSQSQIDRVLEATGLKKFIKATKESQRSKTFDSFLRTMFYGESEISPFPNEAWNKRINSAFGLASLQVMTFNFPAHLTNILSGEVQNVIEAVGGRYMTMRDYIKGKTTYAAHVHEFWQDYAKEGNRSFWSVLAEKLDVPQGDYENEFGNKTKFSRLREWKSHVMIIKQGGEHEMQVSTMIAMANNHKVKLGDRTVPLNEALELRDGQIQIKAEAKNMDGSAFTEADLNVFQDRVHSVVRALNGAYSKIDKTVAEKHFLGKLAFFMRKYFLPMAYRRFEPYKYDYEERDFKEGYYRTVWRLMGDMIRFNKQIVQNWDTYTKTLTPVEIANLRRFITEVSIIIALAGAIWAIGGTDDDRKLKGRWLYTMALYELMKVKSETETLLPGPGFNEIVSIFSSPFVPATTAKAGKKVLTDLWNTAFGDADARFKRDYGVWDEGDLRLPADALKLLGAPVDFIWSPENILKNFELRNR